MLYQYTAQCHSVDNSWVSEFVLSYNVDLNVYMQMRFV